MPFFSILFLHAADRARAQAAAPPACLADLNLDQVITWLTTGRQVYALAPFFYTPLKDVDAIRYRQEVFRDLEDRALFEQIETFGLQMSEVRRYLRQAEKLHTPLQQQRWFLDAAALYCSLVQTLEHDLAQAAITSRGLVSLCEYLRAYTGSERFAALRNEAQQLLAGLAEIHYCVHLHGNRVTVRKYAGELDYSAEVGETFEKFKQGAVKDYRVEHPNPPEMNHIEAHILECVARLYPDVFQALDLFCTQHRDFLDETLVSFDREIQFYMAYLGMTAELKRAGLQLCYPEVDAQRKDVYSNEGYNLALAYQRTSQRAPVVANSFYLANQERILIVSGPNQGGKTTFAQAFGQLHFLACLGCPVPGKDARMFLFDQLFTHFEQEEDLDNLRGKLEDELVRIHAILRAATPASIIIMNETFGATTLHDALFLGKKVMDEILALDLLCVCVTFMDELATISAKTVSMVSTVDPADPAVRTFKIVRRAADGLAYALSIAEKYRLTYADLKDRVRP